MSSRRTSAASHARRTRCPTTSKAWSWATSTVVVPSSRSWSSTADIEADLGNWPESAGLKAMAIGFRKLYGDRDHEKLEALMLMDDALYAWCQEQVPANAIRVTTRARPHPSLARRLAENEPLGALLYGHR
jgi:hypothetical protein